MAALVFVMLRLMMLLAAGGYIYSLGHNSAVASSPEAGPSKPSMMSSIASTGAGWIAREVHEQTAWAAEKPAEAVTAAEAAPPQAPVYSAPVAAAFAEAVPVAVPRAPTARRGLQVIIEPAGAG